jgi:hypothetical protein
MLARARFYSQRELLEGNRCTGVLLRVTIEDSHFMVLHQAPFYVAATFFFGERSAVSVKLLY